MIAVPDAYERCEDITKHAARNFAYGIRLLAPPERRALASVYAFARRIDDIGDGTLPAAAKEDGLDRCELDVTTIAMGGQVRDEPVLVALADATTRYQLPLDAFSDLISGCRDDVAGTTYQTIDDLVGYCRKVAGSIGRLSLAVFGCDDRATAEPIADDLGVALQLTNILRDVVEDRAMGRVYLPAEDAVAFGCAPDATGEPSCVADLVRHEATVARGWFDRGLQLLPHLDGRSRACVAAMAGIYERLLRRIEHDPASVLDRRVSLPVWEKAWVAARSLAGATP